MDDLLEFDDEQRKTVVRNIKNLASTMSVAQPNFPPAPIRGISYAIGAISLSQLKVASEEGCYYDLIDRTTGPVNMAWNNLSYFDFQWKALLPIKASQSDSEIPKLTKNLQVMKWAQTIIDFWTTYIGAINLPLTYLIREDPTVTHTPPALEIDRLYLSPNDSICSELVERVTYIHALFTTDNQVLYGHPDEATRLSLAAYTVMNNKKKETEELPGKLSCLLTIRQVIGIIKLLGPTLSFPQLFGKKLVPLP